MIWPDKARIRDKIAASKAKGMWMGGLPPLGYDLPTDPMTRALVVNPSEAETVRLIFATYLELGSVHALMRRLDERCIRSKLKTTREGREIGGLSLNRGALFHMLSNKVYRGRIIHGDKDHPGAHPAIVDQDIFQAVETKLTEGARRVRGTPSRVGQALLKGRIFDADGEAMSPTFTHGAKGQVYRYYLSASLQQGGKAAPGDCTIRRVAADALEAKIAEVLTRFAPARIKGEPIGHLARVEIHAESLRMLLPIAWLDLVRARLGPGEEAIALTNDAEHLHLVLPIRMSRRGGRNWILGADENRSVARRDPVLIEALRHAHAALSSSADGAPMLVEAPANPHHRKRVRLAFLAPELQVAILAATHPAGLSLDQLSETRLPTLWSEQLKLAAAV